MSIVDFCNKLSGFMVTYLMSQKNIRMK